MSKLLKNKLIANSFSFNRDLAINTKISKTLFDLLKFVDKDSLEQWIKNPSQKTLLVSKVKNIQSILNGLDDAKNPTEVQKYFETYNVHITKKLLNQLENDFAKNIQLAKDEFYTGLTTFNEKFIKLNKQAKEKETENSIWYLNVGAYYISGVTSDQKKFNAPIIIIPVSIQLNKNDLIEIKKLSSSYKTNTKLNFLLNHYYGVQIDDFETDNFDDFNIYYEKLNKWFPIDYQNPFKNNFIEFQNKPEDERNYSDPLQIQNTITLSLFDSDGGKILQDVNEILDYTDNPFKIGSIIKDDKYINEIIDLDNLIAINNKLNIYQKYAIKSSLNENTVIYGPPGTGKSETIASLIANILYQNKNILMVSEKKAALDVVLNRLGNLKYLALNIYDNKNKANFYNKIKELLDVLNDINIRNDINYFYQIKQNSRSLLDNIKESYRIENDILNLNLDDNSLFLKDNHEYANAKVNDQKMKEMMDLIPIKNKNANTIIEYLEKLSVFLNTLNKYQEFKIIILENKNIKFSKTNFDKFKEIYEKTKDKYKPFTLNLFLNTSKIKKGGVFSNKLKKNWIIFDENFISILNELLNQVDDINYSKISLFERITALCSNLKHYEIKQYFDAIKVKEIFNNYHVENETNVNNKIELYEQNSIKNAKNNCDQILYWQIIKLRKFINTYTQSKNDLDLAKQINNIFKVSTRKHFPSVANFIKTNYRALKCLFPIWIMSPNEVSINLPNTENIFDYGIFDEASQMFVENSIPSIFRCEKVCVAGDDKQLRPTSFFATKLNYSDDEIEDDEFVAESLLDKAKESMWYEFNLKNHYRSRNANLIKFSNEHIYNNELETATINGNFNDWIEVYNVNGIWDSKRNSIEIDNILDYLEKHYTKQDLLNETSYLVVTFNQSQKDELENRFAAKLAINNSVLREAYENQLIKFRNIENVQGDEADIVIFSCTYAKNKDGKFIQNFGPLMQENGPNRLNVALTRAKEKMIVFKSFNGDQITNLSNNKNTEIFKQFILAMDNVKTNDDNPDFENNDFESELCFDSKFEEEVYKKLIKRIDQNRFKILTQFKVGSKRIDQVIYDKQSKQIVLGIEIDGLKYHNGYKKILEDIDRQYFLENRGYTIYRIKEFDWLTNQNKVIDEILEIL